MEVAPFLALLASKPTEPLTGGPLNLFIGFFLVLCIFSGALLFTYWISKNE